MPLIRGTFERDGIRTLKVYFTGCFEKLVEYGVPRYEYCELIKVLKDKGLTQVARKLRGESMRKGLPVP